MGMNDIDSGNSLINDTLKDKNVLIFGGGSGIGLETALQATAAGAKVIIVGRDHERTKRTAEEHGFSGWLVADVTNPEAIRQALSTIDVVDHLIMLSGTFALSKILEADVSLLRQPMKSGYGRLFMCCALLETDWFLMLLSLWFRGLLHIDQMVMVRRSLPAPVLQSKCWDEALLWNWLLAA